MQDYYTIPAEAFSKHSNLEFHFVETHQDLCQAVARELVDLIRSNAARGEMTKVILPVGPLDYGAFAELCNQEGVSCESVVIFSMDEYCYADDTAIPIDHPLSFRAFYRNNLIDRLDLDKMLTFEEGKRMERILAQLGSMLISGDGKRLENVLAQAALS